MAYNVAAAEPRDVAALWQPPYSSVAVTMRRPRAVPGRSNPSMTGGGSGIAEGRVHRGQRLEELPVIRTVEQGELEHAVLHCPDLAVPDLADLGCVERVVAASSRPDDELSNPARVVERAVRRLRGEPLVVVLVAHEDHVGVGIVQRAPERLLQGVVAVRGPRAEAGVVPHGERAVRGVRGEVIAQPGELVVATQRPARSHRLLEARVQDNDVPGAEVIAVGAHGRSACGDPKVAEVAVRGRVVRVLLILVVA